VAGRAQHVCTHGERGADRRQLGLVATGDDDAVLDRLGGRQRRQLADRGRLLRGARAGDRLGRGGGGVVRGLGGLGRLRGLGVLGALGVGALRARLVLGALVLGALVLGALALRAVRAVRAAGGTGSEDLAVGEAERRGDPVAAGFGPRHTGQRRAQ